MISFKRLAQTPGTSSMVVIPAALASDMQYYLERDGVWYILYSWQDILRGDAPLTWQNARQLLGVNFSWDAMPVILETFLLTDELMPLIHRIRDLTKEESPKEKDEVISGRFDMMTRLGKFKTGGERKFSPWHWHQMSCWDHGPLFEGFLVVFDESVRTEEVLDMLKQRTFDITNIVIWGDEQPATMRTSTLYIAMGKVGKTDGAFSWEGYQVHLDPNTGRIRSETFREAGPAPEAYHEALCRIFEDNMQAMKYYHQNVIREAELLSK